MIQQSCVATIQQDMEALCELVPRSGASPCRAASSDGRECWGVATTQQSCIATIKQAMTGAIATDR